MPSATDAKNEAQESGCFSSLALKPISDNFPAMSTVFEIENAVQKLSRGDLTTFRDWFLSFDAAAWDKQFEEDAAAGRLDALADEALRDRLVKKTN